MGGATFGAMCKRAKKITWPLAAARPVSGFPTLRESARETGREVRRSQADLFPYESNIYWFILQIQANPWPRLPLLARGAVVPIFFLHGLAIQPKHLQTDPSRANFRAISRDASIVLGQERINAFLGLSFPLTNRRPPCVRPAPKPTSRTGWLRQARALMALNVATRLSHRTPARKCLAPR